MMQGFRIRPMSVDYRNGAERSGVLPGMEPFSIAVPEADLTALRSRLHDTRWPGAPHVNDWSDGASFNYMRELVAYWERHFNWREQERRLNTLPQFRATVSGLKIHYIHLRSGRDGAIPLLLCHGWPGGINEFEKLAHVLMEPDAGPPFDLVIPSMPGYGFSEPQTGVGIHFVADLWGELMRLLGYERFAVQGGDWGAWVAIAMTRRLRNRVIGAHVNYVPARYLPPLTGDSLTAEERAYLQRRQKWSDDESGYIQEQATKPQTLGFAMSDSPVGLAAWIVEKFFGWSGNEGDTPPAFTKDELLTNVSLYWFTNSMYSAMRIYKEARRDIAAIDWSDSSPVPVAVARFPNEIPFPPRSHIVKYLNVARWTEMPAGGHFAAMEQPEALGNDIREFFRTGLR
jgi:pimeloyl-ACP methyl ester carboxylesterase